MSLGLELAKQRARITMLKDQLQAAGGMDIINLKQQLKETKDKIRKLERKIQSGSLPLHRHF